MPMFSAPRKKIGRKKYMVPDDTAYYEEAAKMCVDRGMTLASFDEPSELDDVLDFLSSSTLSEIPLMTSLKKNGNKFRWLNGMISYSKMDWETKSGGDCTSLLQNRFAAVPCEYMSHFMCESPEPQGLPENFQLLPIDKGAHNTNLISTCFYYLFQNLAPRFSVGDKKYLIPAETAANSAKAKTYCESRNMDVVSFETLTESDSVFDFVGALGLDLGASPLLTSLTKGADGSWSWLGGVEARHLFFKPETPNADSGCASLGIDFLTMVPCDKPTKFMCEARGQIALPGDFQFLPAAEAPPINITRSIFLFPSEKVSAAQAEEKCGARNMSLISSSNITEMDMLSDVIGALAMCSNPIRTSMATADTGSSDFMNWAPGQPQNSTDKCIIVKQGFLESASCEEPLSFACVGRILD